MLNNVSCSAAAVPHQMGRCEDCYPEKSHSVTHLSAWHKMLAVGVAHDLFCNHHWSNKHAEDGWKSHWVNASETRKTNYYQKYQTAFTSLFPKAKILCRAVWLLSFSSFFYWLIQTAAKLEALTGKDRTFCHLFWKLCKHQKAKSRGWWSSGVSHQCPQLFRDLKQLRGVRCCSKQVRPKMESLTNISPGLPWRRGTSVWAEKSGRWCARSMRLHNSSSQESAVCRWLTVSACVHVHPHPQPFSNLHP